MGEPHDRLAYRLIDLLLRTALRRLPPSSFTQRTALWWGYSFRPRPCTVRLRSGLRFNFDKVDFIPLNLYYLGVFEPRVIGYLRAIARPSGTVLDVGANVGFHTLEAWKAVGERGRVISIEASPNHAQSLRRNLEANGFPTDDVLNVAVGDRDGEVALGLPDGGNEGMFGINAGAQDAFSISLCRIDDLLDSKQLLQLDLIKMDIEGSELDALRGAARTLAAHQPAILIELNDSALVRCGASSTAVVQFLHNEGYEGWIIDGSGARVIKEGMEHECDECLFLPKSDGELRARLRL